MSEEFNRKNQAARRLLGSSVFVRGRLFNLRQVFVELAMNMTTRIRQIEDVTVVDVSGRIVLGEESAALRNLVSELLGKGHGKILFNLGDVIYIDSSGLGHLVSAYTSVRTHGGELKLLNLAKNIHDVMQMTRLYTVFDVKDNEVAAIRSFGNASAASA